MKTLILLIAIFFISCNDPKDPPDDGFMMAVRADSLARVDSLSNINPNK